MPSKVNNDRPVPETAETVIVVVAASPLAVAEPVRHETVVPDDHDVVAQSTDARLAVGVALMDAKAKPLRVEVVPPDVGALAAPTRELSTGAEKVGGKSNHFGTELLFRGDVGVCMLSKSKFATLTVE